ncbi:MAG: ATP-binding protein [Nitrospinota bacterium]
MAEILLVDDDERIIDSFKRHLERQGYSVLTAKNGEEALEVLKNHTPELIISDVRMPVMDGIEFMKKVPEQKGLVPGRILFTAFDDGEAIELAKIGKGGIFRVEKDRWETDLKPAIARALELREFMVQLEKKAEEELQREKKLAEMRTTEELNKLQNIFVVSINHEFRTPLTGIMGFSETLLIMLKKGNLPMERLKEYLGLIMESGSKLTKLLNSTLEVLVLAKGVYLKHETVSVKDVIDDALTVMKKQADKKNLTLKNNVPDGLPNAEADGERVKQVLKNLLDNAIKFTEHGEVSVSAELEGKFVKIAVKDSGMGIPEDEVEQIFKRFSQLDRSGAKTGMGLGLYICDSLVKLMGGKIWMESTKDKGSTCCFTLPLN